MMQTACQAFSLVARPASPRFNAYPNKPAAPSSQNVTIDIDPATRIANEATALVEPGCRGATNTVARYELYFGRRLAGQFRLNDFQAQPPLLRFE
jgi:hypothetical protein